jgi:hypothetical protein
MSLESVIMPVHDAAAHRCICSTRQMAGGGVGVGRPEEPGLSGRPRAMPEPGKLGPGDQPSLVCLRDLEVPRRLRRSWTDLLGSVAAVILPLDIGLRATICPARPGASAQQVSTRVPASPWRPRLLTVLSAVEVADLLVIRHVCVQCSPEGARWRELVTCACSAHDARHLLRYD